MISNEKSLELLYYEWLFGLWRLGLRSAHGGCGKPEYTYKGYLLPCIWRKPWSAHGGCGKLEYTYKGYLLPCIWRKPWTSLLWVVVWTLNIRTQICSWRLWKAIVHLQRLFGFTMVQIWHRFIRLKSRMNLNDRLRLTSQCICNHLHIKIRHS